MIVYYINSVDVTSDVAANSLKLNYQLQQRANAAIFRLNDGATKPTENQDVRIFVYDTIASFSTKTITLDGKYEKNVGMFFPGQKLRIRINDNDEEEVEVESYDEDNLQIVLVAAPSGTVSQGDKVGYQLFGGVVSKVNEVNAHVLTNLEFIVTCVGYEKIFDKKLVNDTWTSVDGRYIINSFVNTYVNYNRTVDDMDYDDNSAIQAEWIESGDGNNPTVNSSDYMEGDASAVLAWTNSGGTATWSATPTSLSYSDFTGVASGTPTEGDVMCWVKTGDYSNITSVKIRVGSDSSNYAEVTMPLTDTTDWQYISSKLINATITGTPNWAAVDYVAVVIDQTASGDIKINGIRVNAENSFTLYNVKPSSDFDELRSAQQKPTKLMQLLSKTWEYIWYIDFNRDIHYINIEAEEAPFAVTESSNNFIDLSVDVDQSQLGNRVIVLGGEKKSDSFYTKVEEGDDVKREWNLTNKFSDFTVYTDTNTSTDTMEAGTTTTNVTATGHGLETGDYIVNRTRSNAVRKITKVDDDNFTVTAVTGQTTGDTFSLFVAKTAGIDTVDPTTVDYIYNSNGQSVKATDSEATLTTGEFILFKYKERVEIAPQYTDSASVSALKALGLGDGVFDLDPIVDRNIDSLATALAVAQAKVSEYSNPIISGKFKTDFYGLREGKIINIVDSNRSLDDNFVIQKVKATQAGGRYQDYFKFSVSFGSTLFGWIEFMQKLLAIKDKIQLNEDAVVQKRADADEVVEAAEASSTATDGGFEFAKGAETVESSESNQIVDFAKGTWRYEPNGAAQTLESRYNLADYG